ncbi:coiled-coil domain-containing protein 180 [Odontesthes bonariensis]
MCESRAVPSGEVYRQLFDAQVQLSRCLLAGHRVTRTDHLSSEDSNTPHSSRFRSSSSWRQQVDDGDDVIDDVSRLPDSLVVHQLSSDIMDKLMKKKCEKHHEALKQLETHLVHLSQVSAQKQTHLDHLSQVSAQKQTHLVHLSQVSAQKQTHLVHLSQVSAQKQTHLDHLSQVSAHKQTHLDHLSQVSAHKQTQLVHLSQVSAHKQTQLVHLSQVSAQKQTNLVYLSQVSAHKQTHLVHLSQVCETQVRTISQQLLSSLRDVDLRLDTLKDRMDQLEHTSLQEVFALWKEVEEEVKLKKIRISELDFKLSEYERGRSNEIRAALRKHCHLLEDISFLPPPDIHRLIHGEATMLNQTLLANRRSTARLLLLLQEENLQKESGLRQLWEGSLSRWRISRVDKVIDQFRRFCSLHEAQQLVSDQEMKPTQQDLFERHCDIIRNISSLVPPACSPAQVSDWFHQLTAANQHIDCLHAEVLRQLRRAYEQRWRDHLVEAELCKEALSALQLSDQQVNDIVDSQILPLIGQRQNGDEERLAALEVHRDSVAHHTLGLSRCVFVVMQAAALLWETHSHRLERREEELQQQLAELRLSQQRIQEKMRVEDLLGGLRQEGSEDALKRCLDKTLVCLQDMEHRRSVSDQLELLDQLPARFMDEGLSYSSSISSLFHVSPTHTPAESSLLQICDISTCVTFTSSGGVVYSGPAFRCPAPELQQEPLLRLLPVELLTHTLNRTRTLFLDHLEQHVQRLHCSAVAMVMERKEAVLLELELQMQQLKPERIQTHIYQPRLAELQLHQQQVELRCQDVMEVLSSVRVELQQLQTSISSRNQEVRLTLSNMEDELQAARSSRQLEAVSSALQNLLDQHVEHNQRLQTSFRQTVRLRLQEARDGITRLLNSFRMFSEGGDFAPQEVKMFQRQLREKTRRISLTEESIYAELEALESKSFQQVKGASARLQEKLSSLKSELMFSEKIQRMMSSTQVQLKAEAALSNQQQSLISSRLEDLRRLIENSQASLDQLRSILSSVSEDIRKRCQYLDFKLDCALQETVAPAAPPTSIRQVQPPPPPGLLQPNSTCVELVVDPVGEIIRSLNRFCLVRDSAAENHQRGRTAADQSPVQHQQRSAESVNTLSVKKGCRSNRTDIRSERRFQIFGSKQEEEPSTHSFGSSVNSVLWKTNDVLLNVSEDFYRRESLSRFHLLPEYPDQWAESMQQRLLGYQQQARALLSRSREELVKQLSAFRELLNLLPGALISNHGQRHEEQLREEVGGVKKRLEEILAASEKEKSVNIRRLRASLRMEELNTLTSREELRQQQVHSAICRAHLELQECVQARGEDFVTSLASLSEQLLQLDDLLTPAVSEDPDAAGKSQLAEDNNVTMETGAKARRKKGRGSSSAVPPSSVTMATTASTTTAKCLLKHEEVIQHRDAAAKRFQQLLRSESSCSDDNKKSRLSEEHTWNTHWKQQILALKRTHES